MFNVFQPWDPLKVCIVGRSYGPEFYSWINNTSLRDMFEKIAVESEEDFQSVIKILEKFNVKVLRPDLPQQPYQNGVYVTPPMLPRDNVTMIGNTLYENASFDFKSFYNNVKDPDWPLCLSMEDFYNLPLYIQQECIDTHKLFHWKEQFNCYDNIIRYVKEQGNSIRSHIRDDLDICNRAQIVPVGHDYLIGNWNTADRPAWKKITNGEQKTFVDQEFPYTKNHIINTQGHLDSSFTLVKPGLIISDMLDYGLEKVFPNWEIIKVPKHQSKFSKSNLDTNKRTIINRELKTYSYHIPGFDSNPDVTKLIEDHLLHWIGNSAETVFELNLLSIDENNVIMFSNNDLVSNALNRHGITAHIVNLRHIWFWDGGIHCFTSDLHRDGSPRSIIRNS